MFVNSLFERLDTVTLYFSYHSVWESVPYPNRRMKEGSVQCWCFSMRHGHSMIRHGWAGTSCSAGCVWIWQQCLEISRTVTGVHFIKHCDSSYFPSVFSVNHAAIFVWIFSPWFPWFSSLAHSILLESTTTISLLCINHQLRCCNPAVVRLLTAPKIPALLPQSLGLHCSPDSHISTLTLLARLTAARWPSSSLTIRPHHRATHCPVRAIVDSQHRHASSPST